VVPVTVAITGNIPVSTALLNTLYDDAFNMPTQETSMADMEAPEAETLRGAGGFEGAGAVDGAAQNNKKDEAVQRESKRIRSGFFMVKEKYSCEWHNNKILIKRYRIRAFPSLRSGRPSFRARLFASLPDRPMPVGRVGRQCAPAHPAVLPNAKDKTENWKGLLDFFQSLQFAGAPN
jgi:hypothetical protein